MEFNGFTPTQKKIMALLSDGLDHSWKDVLACLGDESATMSNLYPHITYLRRKLKPHGQDVLSRNGFYRFIRLTASPYKE